MAASTLLFEPVKSFDAKRTEVAQTAFNFSQYFSSSFEHSRVAGAVARQPQVVAPEGMSTDGGRNARQSICLTPEVQGYSVITIGWVELPTLSALLRTYQALEAVHRSRFPGRGFDLDPGSYGAFLQQANELLGACGLSVVIEDDVGAQGVRAPAPAARASAASRRSVASSPQFLNYVAVAMLAFAFGAVAGGVAVYARFVGF